MQSDAGAGRLGVQLDPVHAIGGVGSEIDADALARGVQAYRGGHWRCEAQHGGPLVVPRGGRVLRMYVRGLLLEPP